MDSFVVTSALDGKVLVWTIGGVLVGEFGTGRLWTLGEPSTYLGLVKRLRQSVQREKDAKYGDAS